MSEFTLRPDHYGTAAAWTYIIPDTQPEPAPVAATPWIAFKDRKPTEKDLPYVCGKGGELCETRFKNFSGPHDNTGLVQSQYTHWMPVPPLPVERKKSQEEKDKDEAKRLYPYRAGILADYIEWQRDAFLAGLRHEREQGKEKP